MVHGQAWNIKYSELSYVTCTWQVVTHGIKLVYALDPVFFRCTVMLWYFKFPFKILVIIDLNNSLVLNYFPSIQFFPVYGEAKRKCNRFGSVCMFYPIAASKPMNHFLMRCQ